MGENYESSSSVEISSEISSESEVGEVSENIEIRNEISESEESYDDYSDCVEELTVSESGSEVSDSEAYGDYSDCVEELPESEQNELEESCFEGMFRMNEELLFMRNLMVLRKKLKILSTKMVRG